MHMMFSKKIQEALNNFPNIMGHENSKKEAQQNFQPSIYMDPVYRRVESIARLKNNRSKPCTLQCLEEVKPRYFRAVYKDGSHKIVTVFVNSEGQSVGEATVRLINTCSVSSTRQQSASAQSSRSCNRTRPTDKAQPLFAPESLSGGEDSLEGFSASSDTKSLSENECADGKRRKKWTRSPTGGINVGIRPDLTNSGPKPTDSCSSGLDNSASKPKPGFQSNRILPFPKLLDACSSSDSEDVSPSTACIPGNLHPVQSRAPSSISDLPSSDNQCDKLCPDHFFQAPKDLDSSECSSLTYRTPKHRPSLRSDFSGCRSFMDHLNNCPDTDTDSDSPSKSESARPDFRVQFKAGPTHLVSSFLAVTQQEANPEEEQLSFSGSSLLPIARKISGSFSSVASNDEKHQCVGTPKRLFDLALQSVLSDLTTLHNSKSQPCFLTPGKNCIERKHISTPSLNHHVQAHSDEREAISTLQESKKARSFDAVQLRLLQCKPGAKNSQKKEPVPVPSRRKQFLMQTKFQNYYPLDHKIYLRLKVTQPTVKTIETRFPNETQVDELASAQTQGPSYQDSCWEFGEIDTTFKTDFSANRVQETQTGILPEKQSNKPLNFNSSPETRTHSTYSADSFLSACSFSQHTLY